MAIDSEVIRIPSTMTCINVQVKGRAGPPIIMYGMSETTLTTYSYESSVMRGSSSMVVTDLEITPEDARDLADCLRSLGY